MPFFSAEHNRLGKFASGPYEKHLCEIILNLDQWTSVSEEDAVLRYFLSTASTAILFGGAKPFYLDNCGRGYYEEHFCNFFCIWTSYSWGGGGYFLYTALLAILFGGANQFRQFRQRAL